ncbi:MAG: alpha/beta hydrolase family protein [Pseudomonadota bacterium]
MLKRWRLFLLGWALVLAGSWLAGAIQTAGGIKITDVRFPGADGVRLSGLLYTPPTATPEHPAPGVLAVHGYINSRETQSAFAIEFARRGYVILAMDQTGHGYSGGPAFSQGFGGPAGLAYLRGLPMVDKADIGLEGHSMGGWTVLAAAAAMPDAYKAVVLEGSSTGAPFAAEGTPAWPRNMALVFSRYDEFSKLMWGVDRARDIGGAPRLRALFGASDPVEVGRLYGSIPAGTARRLTTPPVTHPGDHLSTRAVGDAVDWFGRTLAGGTPRPARDQIWMWKELGTGVTLVGFVVLLLGTFELLLGLPWFSALRGEPVNAVGVRTRGWWGLATTTAVLPVLLYFPAFILVFVGVKPSPLLPQTVSTQVVVWMAATALLTLLIGWFQRRRPMAASDARWLPAAGIALASVAMGYLALVVADALFKVDFRFWVVALKLFSAAQAKIALIYILPITAFFLVALRALHGRLSVAGDGGFRQYASNKLILSGGFLAFLLLDYGVFFVTGRLPTAFDPLSTVIAIQFLPLLSIVAAISTFCWRRTNSHVPGALVNGLFVTWYVVAGTATQAV